MTKPLCLAALLLAVACSNSTDSSPVASFVVTPNPIELLRGTDVQLNVSAVDAQGNLVTGVSVTFSSANNTIATVTSLGFVSGTQKGSTSIRVSGAGAHTDVPVSVTVPVAGLRLTPATAVIHANETVQYTAQVVDIDGDPIAQQPTVQYSSQDPTIVTISATGLARAVGPTGTTFIGAQTPQYSTSTQISVLDSSVLRRVYMAGSPQFLGVFASSAYIARPFSNKVAVFNLLTDAVVDSIAVGNLPCGVVFNRAGTTAYVANQSSDNISIINVATRAVVGTIPLNGDPLPVAVPAGDSVVFVTTNANKLFKVRRPANTVVDSIALPATSHHLFVHPNDTLLYVATRDAGTVLEINWRTMAIVRTFTLGVQTLGMEMAPDRSELYVTTQPTNALYIVTLSNGAVSSAPVEAGASTIALSADGTQLYVGELFAGQVEVLDRVTRAHVKTIVTGGTVRDMATDVPRHRVIVTNEAGWVDIVR